MSINWLKGKPLNSFRVIVLAILLAITVAIIPLVMTFYLSWHCNIEYEKNRLVVLSQIMNKQTSSTFAEAEQALQTLKGLKFTPTESKAVSKVTRNLQQIAKINNTKNPLIYPTLGSSNYQMHSVATNLENHSFVGILIQSLSRIYDTLCNDLFFLCLFGFVITFIATCFYIIHSHRKLSLLDELAIAIDKHQFKVYYQPIIELKTGQCTGVEALIRWQRPNGELFNPESFIPQAEKSGLILKITDQVIDMVIEELGELLTLNKNLYVSINIGSDDIKTGRVLTLLEKKLKNTSILFHQICIEVTEGRLLELAAAHETINRARELGFTVAIDDFGTGYSSLLYLQNLSLDILKIDKSFVDTIATDSATSNVTPHIINMAKTLKLKIIAEGIEKQQQLDYLLSLNVEYGQGWLFSKAVDIDAFKEFYSAQH